MLKSLHSTHGRINAQDSPYHIRISLNADLIPPQYNPWSPLSLLLFAFNPFKSMVDPFICTPPNKRGIQSLVPTIQWHWAFNALQKWKQLYSILCSLIFTRNLPLAANEHPLSAPCRQQERPVQLQSIRSKQNSSKNFLLPIRFFRYHLIKAPSLYLPTSKWLNLLSNCSDLTNISSTSLSIVPLHRVSTSFQHKQWKRDNVFLR